MGQKTLIQWSDDTCNPISGCKGCELHETPGQLLLKIKNELKERGLKVPELQKRIEGARKKCHKEMVDLQSALHEKKTGELVQEILPVYVSFLKKPLPKDALKNKWVKDTDEWIFETSEDLFDCTEKWFRDQNVSLKSIDLPSTYDKAYHEAVRRADRAVGEIADRLTTTSLKAVLKEDVLPGISQEYGQETVEVIQRIIGSGTACYASMLTRMRSLSVAKPLKGTNAGYAPEFETLTRRPGEMALAAKRKDLLGTVHPTQPWKKGLPRMIFISDMGDSLSLEKDFAFLAGEVLGNVTCEDGSRHIWQWLTKRPEHMAKFAEYHCKGMLPRNLMAMTTLTCWDKINGERLDYLKTVGAHMRGLSVEPLRGPIPSKELKLNGVDWMIIGGESGDAAKHHPLHLEWVLDLIKSCRRQGVAVFVKQWGAAPMWNGQLVELPGKDTNGKRDDHGGDWNLWETCDQIPQDVRDLLHVREFPQAFYDYRPIPRVLKLTRPTPMQDQVLPALTKDEKKRFDQLDAVVRKGAEAMVEAAKALHEIKAGKLYRTDYGTFEEYCQKVHDMTRQHANRLERAGMAVIEMEPIGSKFGLTPEQLPQKESQLRELIRVEDPEKRCEILAEVIKETEGSYTAKDLAAKVAPDLSPKKKSRKETPSVRLSKAKTKFDRLREIVGELDYGEDEVEVVGLLKDLEKLLK